MTDESKPYAYQRWCCSTCDGEPISEDNGDNGDADLRCETCGHLFKSSLTGFAEYVPDPEDDDDE